MTQLVAWDLETDRFGPSNLAPEPVCMSVAADDLSCVVASCEKEFDELLVFCLENELQTNANIAFDMSVILAHRPHLADKVWRAYDRSGVTDILIREKLLTLADTGDLEYLRLPNGAKSKLLWSQAAIEQRRLGIDRTDDKEDEDAWRSNYSALKGIPAKDYPREAYEYSRDDAWNARLIHLQQDESPHAAGLRPQFLSARASLGLYLNSCWGFAVDHEMVEVMFAKLSEEYSEHHLVERDGKTVLAFEHLLKLGILRPSVKPRPHANKLAKAIELVGGKEPGDWEPHIARLAELGIKFTKPEPSSYNHTEMRKLVVAVSEKAEIPVRYSDPSDKFPNGQVSFSEEVLQDLEGLDEAIDEYIERSKIQKLVTTELPRMRAGRVHPKYDILKKTGRTSSFGNSKKDKDPAYPAVNIQQIDPRVREAYIASPGMVLCSVDYSYIELVSAAQKCLDLFGKSVLAETINKGWDPHGFLASRIIRRFDPEFRFSDDAEENYHLFMALEKTDPKKWKHFRNLSKPTGLGFWGGLGATRFLGYAKSTFKIDIIKIAGNMPAALEMATMLKQEWKNAIPEAEAYFQWITRDCKDLDWSEPGDDRFCYQTPFGMIRRNMFYTEATNGAALQSPTAEGAKIAIWRLAKAFYDASVGSCLLGCHQTAFIHDEFLAELPHDELLHERAFEMARIAREGMEEVMTKVKVSTAPVCMFRWNKDAKQVLGPDGRIRVWTPPPQL